MVDNKKINWYVAHTRVNQELWIKKKLDELGIENFLPQEEQVRETPLGRKTIRVLLIHGMIFIHTDKATSFSLINDHGLNIVYLKDIEGRHSLIVPDKQMQDFMFLLDFSPSGIEVLNKNLKRGDRVRVIKGPLQGLEGELVRLMGHKRVVIRLEGVVSIATSYIPGSFLERIEQKKMMEKGLFYALYDRLREVNFRSYSPDKLSAYLHGYLTVYAMVRIYPWLETEFGVLYDIHERAKEIARWYEVLVQKKELPANFRAGYAADLMDVYQLYSDLDFLEKGVDAAYDILTPWGSQKLVLPCRTSNICRLLCNCYYFTGDAECGELAGKLVTEALGYTRGNHRGDLLGWWDAICLYDNVVGLMELPIEEQERLKEERVRLAVRVRQVEDDMIEQFVRMGEVSSVDVGQVFYILAKREFVACNEKYEKKE